MIRLLNIIGARPQIIKAAAISRAIRSRFSGKIEDIVMHTGQHYDENMSQVFIKELEISEPRFNLNIGSGQHGVQTARMIEGIEQILLAQKPHAVLVYGDTNSTLAAAVAASKLHFPLIHVEAGLRSFNKKMPEEINRIMCDHASTLLFTPTKAGLHNLWSEGFSPEAKAPYTMNNPGVFHCGDVMYDNSLYYSELAAQKSKILHKHNLCENGFVLVTIHRDHNTDNPDRLTDIFETLLQLSGSWKGKFFVPLHPRTSKILTSSLPDLYEKIFSSENILLSEPVSFFDMILLEENAEMIITDSGGVQKEAYFFKKPCIILRPETEWIELVENKTAILADADPEKIKNAWFTFMNDRPRHYPPVFGDGKAAEFICEKTLALFE